MTGARPIDLLGRPLTSLRMSVTDRCNMRCRYCMPENEYTWLPRESLLTFEELRRLARAFVALGVTRIRLTGGEPLLRRDLPALVALLRREESAMDLALTTNGSRLVSAAAALRRAGLDRVTVSLDTLRPERLARFARTSCHHDILAGIAAAGRAGFDSLKINTVVVRGFNDDEVGDFVEFGRRHRAEVRFIEYMDVGGATAWTPDQVVSRREILATLTRRYGAIESIENEGRPAERFRLLEGLTFGIVASVTKPFCGGCDRSRLTADGMWLTCLYTECGLDLRLPLRSGATGTEISELIASAWQRRSDRGAETRSGFAGRGVLYPREALRTNPHREMHTRGG